MICHFVHEEESKKYQIEPHMFECPMIFQWKWRFLIQIKWPVAHYCSENIQFCFAIDQKCKDLKKPLNIVNQINRSEGKKMRNIKKLNENRSNYVSNGWKNWKY